MSNPVVLLPASRRSRVRIAPRKREGTPELTGAVAALRPDHSAVHQYDGERLNPFRTERSVPDLMFVRQLRRSAVALDDCAFWKSAPALVPLPPPFRQIRFPAPGPPAGITGA